MSGFGWPGSGGGGEAGGKVLLAEEELASDGVFDFPSLSQSYNHLIIEAILRSDAGGTTSEGVNLSLNGDTTDGNYISKRILIQSDGSSYHTYGADRNVPMATRDGEAAGRFGVVCLKIPDYTEAFIKEIQGILNTRKFSGLVMAEWHSLSAVNRVQIDPFNGTNFKAGSLVRIYGEN